MNKLLDTYSDFLAYWEKYGGKDMDSLIDGWAAEYMSKWPELLQKQKDDYGKMSLDWREVGARRVFPFLNDRIEGMSRARALLSVMIDHVHNAAEETFGMDLDILYVLYVGLGCGAGWDWR